MAEEHWLVAYRWCYGRKVSLTALAVERCALCDTRLKDVVVDAPLAEGPWAYLCLSCADKQPHGIGSIHPNYPERASL